MHRYDLTLGIHSAPRGIRPQTSSPLALTRNVLHALRHLPRPPQMTALLPGVSVGTVEGRSIVEPIRRLLPGTKHPEESRFYEASAVDVDPLAKTLTCRDMSPVTNSLPEFTLAYDRLVVSVGAPFNTYGAPGVEQHAYRVKVGAAARSMR